MQVISSVNGMQSLSVQNRQEGKSIGFVPTMGYLHEGHLSLVRAARKDNDFLVVSIFVNPTQFCPTEDFNKYPRDFKRDSKLAKKEKVDCLFHPSKENLYSGNFKTFVSVEDLSDCLCGITRPGHFRGVTTIVAKLFNIVCPDTAYFGQKDAQQAIIVRKMTKDLNFPVKIKVLPTVREKDGLAMSSRNKYLSPLQRREAPVLYAGLKRAKYLIINGVKDTDKVKSVIYKMISRKKTARLEYIEMVDAKSLKPVRKIRSELLIAIACRFGKTRLIDNMMVRIKK